MSLPAFAAYTGTLMEQASSVEPALVVLGVGDVQRQVDIFISSRRSRSSSGART